MSLTSFARPLLSTFCFLLFSLLTFTPLRAESSAYFKTTDSPERSTERLHEFLEDIGYTVERDSEEASEIYVYQQSQKLALEVRTRNDDLTSIIAQVRYRFNPKAGTPESRAIAANKFNDEHGGLKVCVDEEAGGMYFEFMLQFDNYLRPRLVKSFIDRIIITSHHFLFADSDFKQTFFGDENSPDSATNADEVESHDDNDESMTDNEGNDATTPAAEEVSTPASPASPANPSSSTQQSPEPPSPGAAVPPSSPSSQATQPPSSTAVPPSSSPSAPAASQPTAPTANPTPTTSPSLETALPPTTPAAPARTKKARA